MSFETLKLESILDGQGCVLRIDRPLAMNALNQQVIAELEQAITKISENDSLRVLLITGGGEKSFVAGADIKEMADLTTTGAQQMSLKGQQLFDRIQDLRCPVLAVVNGFALGGGMELALACDFIIASEKAKFGLPEVSLGLIPGYGGTQRLSRSVGKAWARRLVLTGEMLTASQALQIGLVTEVVALEQLMPRSLEIATMITQRGPLAVSMAKQAINQGHEMEINEGLRLEADYFTRTFSTEDHAEGIKAFIEKRPPRFEGR